MVRRSLCPYSLAGISVSAMHPNQAAPASPRRERFAALCWSLHGVTRDDLFLGGAAIAIAGLGILAGALVEPPRAADGEVQPKAIALIRPADLPADEALSAALVELSVQEPDFARVLQLTAPALRADAREFTLHAARFERLLAGAAFSELPVWGKEVLFAFALSIGRLPLDVGAELERVVHRQPYAPRYANICALWIHRARGDADAAFEALVREARHPDAESERAIVLAELLDRGDWRRIRELARDERLRKTAGAWLDIELAAREGDWGRALRAIVAAEIDALTHPDHAVLAAVTLAAWFVFLVQQAQRPTWSVARMALFFLAIVLGAASVVPTLLAVAYQDSVLGMGMGENLAGDLVYCFLGIGLREETAKLACFLPLIPLLWRSNGLTCLAAGGCVGLGFAAQENIGYFGEATPAVAYGRVLTANMLHMGLTALAAYSLMGALRRPWPGIPVFGAAFAGVVGLHGAYDLFLVNERLQHFFIMPTAALGLVAVWFFETLKSERGPQLDFFAPRAVLFLAVASVFAASIYFASIKMGIVTALFTVGPSAVALALVAAIFTILAEDVDMEEYLARLPDRRAASGL